ncbi:peptide-binding protein [candidate division CSSED10-310 bacterium]|uniref:Peptide-binding protein n=1 Tax=candidate division CSSED10-310 bacterium TaxID=2855610 RepID=A0ABV6Z5R1_UNCC1
MLTGLSSRILNVLVFVILALFSAVLCSCQKTEETPTAQRPQAHVRTESFQKITLIRELATDPQCLNPILSNEAPASAVERLIFDSLLDVDGSADQNLIGRLAEKWEISADKLAISFHLRPDVRWHDGKSFTAADVKFTFDSAMSEHIPAIEWKSTIEPIAQVKMIDVSTVQFIMKYPFVPGLLSIGKKKILPKHLLDETGLAAETQARKLKQPVTFLDTHFNRHPIGTGPYLLDEWKTGQSIKLSRHDTYWDGKKSPQIKHILFKIFPSRTVAFNVLKKGNLDVYQAPKSQYRQFMKLSKLNQSHTAFRFYEPLYIYVAWNNRADHRLFSDRRVRKAMTYALDRESFVQKVGRGMAKIISGPFYFASWANNPDIEPWPYDLNKAAELLKKAGWDDHDGDGLLDKNGQSFRFKVIIPGGSTTFPKLATLLQANLKKLSIQVLINQVEWSLYLDKTHSGDFDAYVGGWSSGLDPDSFSTWHSSQIGVGNNDIGYQNKEVDQLLEEGRRTFTREQRIRIYHNIHQILHEDQPYTFVCTPMKTYIVSKRIDNVYVSPRGLFDFYPGQLSWTLVDGQ